MKIIGPELFVWARTVYGEARGEGLDGKIAVAWVIRNRVEADLGKDNKPDWWGEGIIGVCRAPKQFSCWNRDDPNYDKIMAVGLDDPAFQACLYAVLGVVLRYAPDPTCGSTHYHHVNISPSWANGKTPIASIGKHAYFNNVK